MDSILIQIILIQVPENLKLIILMQLLLHYYYLMMWMRMRLIFNHS